MRLAWLTDIHLNFVDNSQRKRFLESVRDRADAVAISGDIGESPDVGRFLVEMDEIIGKPIYFVLGNHDFYRGSIAKTRLQVADIAHRSNGLEYLTASGVVELTPDTAIVGHDGWADGRCGDFWKSNVMLSDYMLVAELSKWYVDFTLDKEHLIEVLHTLAQEAARHFEKVLVDAVDRYRNVIAVTHVPPFREAAWYEGKVSDDNYLPHFSCKVVGEVLEKVMQAHSQTNLLVLCGHTHGGGRLQVLDNLQVLTGAAKYKEPAIQQVFEIE
ncbi:MAG: metallophosphoesterase [Pirellulales bacterium]|nr:metallophosphoesterase [Pirellulales bacterium]